MSTPFSPRQYPELKLPPIHNVGISGQKAEDLVQRFQKDVIDKKPAVVTISVGINDVWHRAGKPHDPHVLAQYWINVSKMVEMAQKAGIKVILLTPTVIGENAEESANKRLRIYVEAEKQIAREQEVHAGRSARDVPDGDRQTAGRPGPGDKWLTSDGVHMSPPAMR